MTKEQNTTVKLCAEYAKAIQDCDDLEVRVEVARTAFDEVAGKLVDARSRAGKAHDRLVAALRDGAS